MGNGMVFEACSPSSALKTSAQALCTEGNFYEDGNHVCFAISVPKYLGGVHAKNLLTPSMRELNPARLSGPSPETLASAVRSPGFPASLASVETALQEAQQTSNHHR